MATTAEIIQTIDSIKASRPDLYFGLRYHHGIGDDYEPLQAGDTAPDSFSWDDGEPTDEELCGTCALTLEDESTGEVLDRLSGYAYPSNGQYVLLGAYSVRGGDDPGEIVMSGADVFAVWERRQWRCELKKKRR